MFKAFLIREQIQMIDIIIPIYNAYEELVKCINSVCRHSDFSKCRLILIDDCSTDERISSYLASLSDSNNIIMKNDNNRGFSENVNLGFEQSEENDVVLLNSDTIVTAGWLDKIYACAYLKRDTGMVSPLSNSATICSIPEFCRDNPLPSGYTADTFGELVEKVSLHRYPQLSVCVGFCMYIKREVIRLVGRFDAETFERGYGEECDFCYRARLLGYKSVLADDTFVYHSGTASFLPETKQKLAEEHERILINRYPELTDENKVFYTSNPIKEIQDNIKLAIALNNGKKNILFFSHRDFAEGTYDNIGGTQYHIKDLKNVFVEQYNIVILTRNYDRLRITMYSTDCECYSEIFVGKASKVPEKFNSDLKRIYEVILKSYNIDLIHVHHIKELSQDIFYVADELNIPVVFTVHDYYGICPSVKLLDCKRKYCEGGNASDKCRACLARNEEIEFEVPEAVPFIEDWRKSYLEALTKCSRIIFPSSAARKIYEKFYGEISSRFCVIEHGTVITKSETHILGNGKRRNKERENRKTGREFRVAFVGGLNEAKGSAVIRELIKKKDKNIKWYVFGGTNEYDIRNHKSENYEFLDWYDRDTITDTLKEKHIDLICILPIWPETFCYVLSETLAAGIPVLATDIGALSNRIDELECGWKIAYESNSEAIWKKISEISKDEESYQKVVNHIEKLDLKTVDDMGKEYKALYSNLLRDNKTEHKSIDFNEFFEISGLHNSTVSDEDYRNTVRELENLKNSYGYRITQYLQVKRWPFKNTARKLVHKFVNRRKR